MSFHSVVERPAKGSLAIIPIVYLLYTGPVIKTVEKTVTTISSSGRAVTAMLVLGGSDGWR